MKTSAPEDTGAAFWSRHNVLSLYLPAAILALGTGIALPALPVYAKSFEVGFVMANMVLVASIAGGLVWGIPTGFLLDRVGRRKVILAGPVLTALSSILMVFAGSFAEVLIYRFVGGAATQMWMLARLAVIADTGSDRQRGRQITGMHAVDSVGRISGPLVGGLIATYWDIRIPFLVHGVMCLLAVLPSFILIQETAPTMTGRSAAGSAGDKGTWRTALAWLSSAPMLGFLAAQLVGAVCRGALHNGTLLFYAVYTYGVDAATIGFMATAATVVSIPIMVGSGAVMDRFGRKAAIIPGFSTLALALGFMALTADQNWPLEAYVGAFLLVTATATITTGVMQTLGSDIAPAHSRGSFFGFSQTVVQVGHVLSPTAFALLAEHVSPASGFLFLAILSAAVVVIVGTMVRDVVGRQSPATA